MINKFVNQDIPNLRKYSVHLLWISLNYLFCLIRITSYSSAVWFCHNRNFGWVCFQQASAQKNNCLDFQTYAETTHHYSCSSLTTFWTLFLCTVGAFETWMPLRCFAVYSFSCNCFVTAHCSAVCADNNHTFMAYVKEQKGMPQLYCHWAIEVGDLHARAAPMMPLSKWFVFHWEKNLRSLSEFNAWSASKQSTNVVSMTSCLPIFCKGNIEEGGACGAFLVMVKFPLSCYLV